MRDIRKLDTRTNRSKDSLPLASNPALPVTDASIPGVMEQMPRQKRTLLVRPANVKKGAASGMATFGLCKMKADT